MATTDKGGCQCGCGEMTVVTSAAEPCACGCKCCTDVALKSKADERNELEHLRQSVEKRLAELARS